MDISDIQRAQAVFQTVFDAYPAAVTVAYVVLFTLLTALCLPGAAVLMLLAGASFGLVWGSLLATLASTAGATLTMLGARHWLRHRVEHVGQERHRRGDAALAAAVEGERDVDLRLAGLPGHACGSGRHAVL